MQENILLEQALDRVLACDLQAGFNVPGYDNSAMDCYALRAGDLTQQQNLSLIGKAMAGRPFAGKVSQGQCVRIMTGAARWCRLRDYARALQRRRRASPLS